jgi:hypothetical protein
VSFKGFSGTVCGCGATLACQCTTVDATPAEHGVRSCDDWSSVPSSDPVSMLVYALQSLFEFHNVLRYLYVLSYFDDRQGMLLEVKRSQLERSTEFLFAATNPAVDITAVDFRAIRCAWLALHGMTLV